MIRYGKVKAPDEKSLLAVGYSARRKAKVRYPFGQIKKVRRIEVIEFLPTLRKNQKYSLTANSN